ncbi:hypothetical protein QUF54_00370 [Candidatus Marithioploca araucensis]|uniref:Transposase n=1 Tax=Candidatus Marithioploca araucensis TaxID=70273 RepID=A0ABT7VQ49_9GAMM|nr:hypothetical protein [Candidatus Marithioploca araucensis]
MPRQAQNTLVFVGEKRCVCPSLNGIDPALFFFHEKTVALKGLCNALPG